MLRTKGKKRKFDPERFCTVRVRSEERRRGALNVKRATLRAGQLRTHS